MAKPVKKPNDNLWTCDECLMIGGASGATAHVEKTNHVVKELSAEESTGVRAIWRQEGRSAYDGTRFVPALYALVAGRPWLR